MFKTKALRIGLTSLIVLCILFLQSCNEDKDPVIDPPINPPPIVTPLPDKLCSGNFQTGYTDKVSYYPLEKVTAFLHGSANVDLCRLDVYDINHLLAFSIASPLTIQTVNQNDPAVNGYGYTPTVTFDIPANTQSGIYQIENKITLVVKTKNQVDLLIVYPSNTVNAYCTSGGKSLYTTPNRPTQVSFLRPMDGIQSFSSYGLTWFAGLTEQSVGYIADVDLDVYENITNAKILVIIGHNEYWTKGARLNFDSFVDSGKHALVLSGNTMWWQVRYSDDKNNLVCYKEAPDPIDSPLLKTINWNVPSLEYSILSSIGGDFSYGGYGLKTDQGWNGYKIINPASPLLEGLNLQKGDILSIPTSEYDGAPISSFDADGFPVLDVAMLDAEKAELVGFDKGFRGDNMTIGTFIVLKRSSSSGIIVNTSSTDWCSSNGMGGSSGDNIKKITYNAIVKLLAKKNIFSS
jgi:hypothetical protein